MHFKSPHDLILFRNSADHINTFDFTLWDKIIRNFYI